MCVISNTEMEYPIKSYGSHLNKSLDHVVCTIPAGSHISKELFMGNNVW